MSRFAFSSADAVVLVLHEADQVSNTHRYETIVCTEVSTRRVA